tara:strand:- start:333 stop:650 length:318 start_codon:yes stop_codon:yes gene_type:complete
MVEMVVILLLEVSLLLLEVAVLVTKEPQAQVEVLVVVVAILIVVVVQVEQELLGKVMLVELVGMFLVLEHITILAEEAEVLVKLVEELPPILLLLVTVVMGFRII